MKAIVVDEPGGPEQLQWGDADDPIPGPGEVRIRIVATAVNRADTLQRTGRYTLPPDITPIIGLECSGVIDDVGPDVEGWAVGDRVCALLDGGGYAELVTVAAGQVLPIPAGISIRHAAALPEVACTVWSNLMMATDTEKGDDVLVHGGGSGIGTFAIQLLKALGVRTFVTAGSAAKLDRCAELGADVGINYNEEDFVAVINDATGGRGVDLILDNMGGGYLARNLDALADDGTVVTIGLQGGTAAEVDLRRMLTSRLSLRVTSLRSRPPDQKARIVEEVRKRVWPLVEAGVIKPVIDHEYPISDAADAHRLLEASGHVGKLLLTLDER